MKLKKLLSAVIACFLMFSTPLLPCENLPIKIQAGAEEEYMPEDYNGLFYYKKYSDHIEIIGTVDKESLTTLEIPSEIDNLPVTVIGNSVFYGCTNLTSVTIPDSITSIEQSAFEKCTNLTSVIIPESVTDIEAYAFVDCASLTSLTIPENITTIENAVFAGCISLTSVTIPNSVTKIKDEAFYGCTNLTSVTIPESLTYIGGRAFLCCEKLISITIPESVTHIGGGAFGNTPWIADRREENPLVIVNGMIIDGSKYSEDTLIIPDNIKSVSDGAFSDNDKLTSVIIPESVTSVGSSAFYCCTNLISITIPESLTYIGGGAFGYTPWMTEKQKENPLVIVNNILIDGHECWGDVVIPDNVTAISGGVFSCRYRALTSVTIPNSVTYIGEGVFTSCKSLTSLTIPESVTYIGRHQFTDCESLTSLIIKNPECELSEMFDDIEWKQRPDLLTVYGYEGSTAQACAEKNGYAFKILDDSSEEIIYGDANDDKKISISDAVAILQNLANAEKYPLSEQGKINADVDGEAGITGKDAAAIQMYDAGVLTELPVR